MSKPNVDQLSLVVYSDPAELPTHEQPRARLLRDGAPACSTLELLQVLIGGPSAERASRQLLERCLDLRGIANRSILELADLTHGLGQVKAAQLKASFEIGRRLFSQPSESRAQIRTPADAAQILIPCLSLLEQEEVNVLLLDTRNRLICPNSLLIYKGSLNAASMRTCEVFREAIRHNANSIILAHCHPSGDASPSSDDLACTKELAKAGRLLDIELADHIVVGHGTYVSMRERGLGFDL